MAINEKMKWPTNKKQYDINYQKIFGKECKDCEFYDRDKVDHNGPYEGWHCCYPGKCPYGKEII